MPTPFPTVSAVKSAREAMGLAKQINARAQSVDASLAGSVSGRLIREFRRDLIVARDRLDVLKDVPNIAAVLKLETGDEQFPVATSFAEMKTALEAVIGEVEAAFPADGEGYLLDAKFSAAGESTRSFGTGATANLRLLTQDLVAAIA